MKVLHRGPSSCPDVVGLVGSYRLVPGCPLVRCTRVLNPPSPTSPRSPHRQGHPGSAWWCSQSPAASPPGNGGRKKGQVEVNKAGSGKGQHHSRSNRGQQIRSSRCHVLRGKCSRESAYSQMSKIGSGPGQQSRIRLRLTQTRPGRGQVLFLPTLDLLQLR